MNTQIMHIRTHSYISSLQTKNVIAESVPSFILTPSFSFETMIGSPIFTMSNMHTFTTFCLKANKQKN